MNSEWCMVAFHLKQAKIKINADNRELALAA